MQQFMTLACRKVYFSTKPGLSHTCRTTFWMVPWIVLFSLLFFPCACSEQLYCTAFLPCCRFNVVFFSLLFLLLCALDTPLGNQALFSTTPIHLNSPPPLLRNVSRTPPNCLVSLSYLTLIPPQCWAFLLFNHSPPLITSSSCPLNVQKRIKKWCHCDPIVVSAGGEGKEGQKRA